MYALGSPGTMDDNIPLAMRVMDIAKLRGQSLVVSIVELYDSYTFVLQVTATACRAHSSPCVIALS